MRKRWHVSETFKWAMLYVWALGWLPIGLIIGALATPCDRHGCGLNSDVGGWQPYAVFMAIWFGVVLVPAIVIGTAWLVRFMWRERPRRVVEPVTTDLRETDR